MMAVILAAGMGTRLNRYTQELPKCLLPFNNSTLLQIQIDILRENNIHDITIVTGYQSEKINIPNVKYCHNARFNSTNMVYSMFCALDHIDDDVVVAYGDIIYESRILQSLLNNDGEIVASIDIDWQSYWKARYNRVDFDLEGLRMDGSYITHIGHAEDKIADLDGRYIGLNMIRKKGLAKLKELNSRIKLGYKNNAGLLMGTSYDKAYVTDLLQFAINEGIQVSANKVVHGWLEFDTNEDYERMTALLDSGDLAPLFRIA